MYVLDGDKMVIRKVKDIEYPEEEQNISYTIGTSGTSSYFANGALSIFNYFNALEFTEDNTFKKYDEIKDINNEKYSYKNSDFKDAFTEYMYLGNCLDFAEYLHDKNPQYNKEGLRGIGRIFEGIQTPEFVNIGFEESDVITNKYKIKVNSEIILPEFESDSKYNKWCNISNFKYYEPGEEITINVPTILKAVKV